jgi:cholesterol transport system auxiliary component
MKTGCKVLVNVAVMACTALLLASCSLFTPVTSDPSKAVLNQLPLDVPQRTPHTATLLVLAPDTSPIYDTTRMAYISHPFQVAYFSKLEWAATPSQMLLPLLVRTLEKTRYFSAVITPPYAGSYSYALRSEIVAITQDFTTEPAAVRLSLRLQLSDSTGQIIATREIELREPLHEKTSYAGVIATNHVTAEALQEVAGFVLGGVDSGSHRK